MDGVDTPCEMVYSSLQSGGALQCPPTGCPSPLHTYQGNYGNGDKGGSYSLIAGVSGWVWINNANGEELDPEAAAEIGLGNPWSPTTTDPDNLKPNEVLIRPANSPVMVRMRTPYLVSCKEGERQYATITLDNVKSIENIGVFNVSSGLQLVGRPTAMGPAGSAVQLGTYYQYFYTTTGGLMTWYASGMAVDSTGFHAYARESIQCQ